MQKPTKKLTVADLKARDAAMRPLDEAALSRVVGGADDPNLRYSTDLRYATDLKYATDLRYSEPLRY